MSIELASALCARLCHDISSPLGTLSGTLELAADEPEQAAEALAIAGEAATALVDRLRLLRAAWAGDCGPLDRTQIGHLAKGLPARVQVDVQALPAGPFTATVARILLNLLLLGADALPVGGTVAVSGTADTELLVAVTGRSVAWNPALVAAIADPAGPHTAEPRTVQVPLTLRLAAVAGFRLSFLLAGSGQGEAPRLLLSPA